MIPGASRIFPLKTVISLTVAVLLAHLAVLKTTPMSWDLSPSEPARRFITRVIEWVPEESTLKEHLAAPTAMGSEKDTPTLPAKAKPRPAAVHASPPMVAPSPPVILEAQHPEPSPTALSLTDGREVALLAVAGPPSPSPRPARDRLALAVTAYKLPASVHFKYKVEANKFPYNFNAELWWQQDGSTYDARLALTAFGLGRTQTSHGQITADGLAPLRFSDKVRSEVAAHFDRDKGKVTFSANTPDVPLQAGAQDRLSVLVQVGAMIAGDPAHYPQGSTMAFQTVGPRAADTWIFTVGSHETLSLPGGQQATLKLVRNPREEFDQKVELWLAPALGYLPARIRITESNGDFVDQKWLSTEPPG
jgi:hypothetical protein